MRRAFAFVVLGVLLAALAAPAADARWCGSSSSGRRRNAGGEAFGDAGPFERLDGTVHMEVDPDDPLNAVIVNLDRAPRNEWGLVELSAPFFIVKPVDMTRGQREAAVRHQQPRKRDRARLPHLPGDRPRRRRRAVLPPRLHAGGRGLGGRRGDDGNAARGQPAGRGAGRRQPRRLAHPHRVSVRPDGVRRRHHTRSPSRGTTAS